MGKTMYLSEEEDDFMHKAYHSTSKELVGSKKAANCGVGTDKGLSSTNTNYLNNSLRVTEHTQRMQRL